MSFLVEILDRSARQYIVHATINASELWSNCIMLHLTKNIRLLNTQNGEEKYELEQFADWIAKMGDGILGGPNDGITEIDIPEDLLLRSDGDPIRTIIESTYPSFQGLDNDSSYLQGRAILAPTNEVVKSINQYMIALTAGECRTYQRSDSPCKSDSGSNLLNYVRMPEFLNEIKSSGLPNHEIKLKVGTPIMLMHNIDHSLGLCNGTRLVLKILGDHVIQAIVLSGSNARHKVLIPRMSLTPFYVKLPFKFQRRQFPLMISYAMTINKSQSQSLSHIGLILKKPIFSYGQLYVIVSRVTNRRGLKILIYDESSSIPKSTTNVMYKEVFRNL